jgi:hypothetical protein
LSCWYRLRLLLPKEWRCRSCVLDYPCWRDFLSLTDWYHRTRHRRWRFKPFMLIRVRPFSWQSSWAADRPLRRTYLFRTGSGLATAGWEPGRHRGSRSQATVGQALVVDQRIPLKLLELGQIEHRCSDVFPQDFNARRSASARAKISSFDRSEESSRRSFAQAEISRFD